jgi:hypothetical protein
MSIFEHLSFSGPACGSAISLALDGEISFSRRVS